MTYAKRGGLLAGVATLAIAAGATPAAAQQQDTEMLQIEEIVVTARRFQESLLDIPATVSVLDSATLRDADVERPEDFIGLTAGVSLVNAAEVGDTQVNIRGINGTRDAEASFAFVIDGILYTNPAAFNREYTALEQIEILKGPQGAIYGRNAAAGAIVVTTRKPGNEFQVFGEASYAEDDTVLLNGSVEGPIIEDKLFLRVSADYRDSDGFYRNSFQDNRPIVDDFENWNVKARLVAEPTDDLSIDTKIRYGEVSAGAITFNAVFALPGLAQAFNSPLLFEDVNDHDFVFQPNIDPLNKQDALEISSKLDYSFSGMDLTVWALYSDIDNAFSADGTSGAFGFFNDDPICQQSAQDLFNQGVTLPLPQFLGPSPAFPNSFLGPYTPLTCDGTQFQVRNQEDFSIEARLSGDAMGGRLRWLGGGYFLDLEREVGVNLGRDTGDGVTRELFVPQGQPNATEQLLHDRFDTNVFAVFGEFAFDITEDINVSFAGRYDREERDVTNLVPTAARSAFIDFDGPPFSGGAPLNPGLNPLINPDGGFEDRSRAFEKFQPKVSATWTITPELTAFANWGIGFKSGGFNNQGSQATVDLFINDFLGTNIGIRDDFGKETSSAFEAGLKGTAFQGNVRYELAGFYTDVDDMQFFEFFVGPFGLLRVVSNIDDVNIYGFEASASWQVNDWFKTWANGSLIESEIKANSARPATVGNRSPATPNFNVNLGGQVDVPLTDWVEGFLRADAQIVGPTWFHTVQDNEQPSLFGPGDFSQTRRDTYATLNLRGGFRNETWSLVVFANNLNKSDYVEEVIGAPEFGGSFVNPGPLRRIGVEASFRY